MEKRGWHETSLLRPQLAAQGVELSREQVFRLVKHPPERLSMRTLVALCKIFDCTPADLIVIIEHDKPDADLRQVNKASPNGTSIPVTRVNLT